MKPLLFLLAASTFASAPVAPPPAIDIPAADAKGPQTAVLAGGCFWCTEAVFEVLRGVQKVVSGYAGGDAASADYKKVSAGQTRHAEAIQITYDPTVISFGTILHIFFAVAHDPTQLNRQGPDWGAQYRSAIFYSSDSQKRVAEAYLQQLNAAQVFSKPIVTRIVPLPAFYPAEDYHQDYVRLNPANPYVLANSVPKLQKLTRTFPGLLKKKP